MIHFTYAKSDSIPSRRAIRSSAVSGPWPPMPDFSEMVRHDLLLTVLC